MKIFLKTEDELALMRQANQLVGRTLGELARHIKPGVPQMLLQLIVTNRKWCDFVDYDPRLPQKLQLFIKRFEPTEEELTTALDYFKNFLQEIEQVKTDLLNNQEEI